MFRYSGVDSTFVLMDIDRSAQLVDLTILELILSHRARTESMWDMNNNRQVMNEVHFVVVACVPSPVAFSTLFLH